MPIVCIAISALSMIRLRDRAISPAGKHQQSVHAQHVCGWNACNVTNAHVGMHCSINCMRTVALHCCYGCQQRTLCPKRRTVPQGNLLNHAVDMQYYHTETCALTGSTIEESFLRVLSTRTGVHMVWHFLHIACTASTDSSSSCRHKHTQRMVCLTAVCASYTDMGWGLC